MTEILTSGAVIGILGGGQLGRMLSVAAARLGFRTHVFDPAEAPPAGDVSAAVTRAAFDDVAALTAFADAVDVITYEFENIPAAALDVLEARRPIRPGRRALQVSQDRLDEKRFLAGLGLRVARHAPVDGRATLETALSEVAPPAILKTRRFGYDGKGQALIATAEGALPALQKLADAPALLEGVVTFTREISVIAARGLDGAVVCYDPGENQHERGILRRSTVPAPLSTAQRTDAALLAGRILNALDYVGVMGVELFVTDDGLVVNEIAPRVHNSGHWTQQGCVVDQFEQHIRAIAGWPLGDGRRYADVEMENLIGEEVEEAARIAAEGSAAIHLYGKRGVRPGRKMGHVNRVTGPAAR